MLCYKDQTFCRFYKECKDGEGCFRALTKEIKQGSIDFGLPVSIFADKPNCFEDKETEEIKDA